MIPNHSIENLKEFLKTYITLSENDWNQIRADFEPQVLQKNEMQEFLENHLLESKILTAEQYYDKLLERFPVKLEIDINIAEGKTAGISANPKQASHLASVGKLFTATLISMLKDKGLLSFDDKIAQHLDAELVKDLHVYKGKDYSDVISIKHLLKQTSGLNDVFFPLLKKMINDPKLEMSVKEALSSLLQLSLMRNLSVVSDW